MSVDLIISKTQRALEKELRGIVNITTVRPLSEGWSVEAEVMEMERKGGWRCRNEFRCYNRYEIRFDNALNIIGHQRIDSTAGAENGAVAPAAGNFPPFVAAEEPFSPTPAAPIPPAEANELPDIRPVEPGTGPPDATASAVVADPAADELPAEQEEIMEEGFGYDGKQCEAGGATESMAPTEELTGAEDKLAEVVADVAERPTAEPELATPVGASVETEAEPEPAVPAAEAAITEAAPGERLRLTREEEQILEFLRDCPDGLTREELRKLTGIRLPKLSLHLSRLTARDYLQPADGKYTAAAG